MNTVSRSTLRSTRSNTLATTRQNEDFLSTSALADHISTDEMGEILRCATWPDGLTDASGQPRTIYDVLESAPSTTEKCNVIIEMFRLVHTRASAEYLTAFMLYKYINVHELWRSDTVNGAKSAIDVLRAAGTNMDTLVKLGAGAYRERVRCISEIEAHWGHRWFDRVVLRFNGVDKATGGRWRSSLDCSPSILKEMLVNAAYVGLTLDEAMAGWEQAKSDRMSIASRRAHGGRPKRVSYADILLPQDVRTLNQNLSTQAKALQERDSAPGSTPRIRVEFGATQGPERSDQPKKNPPATGGKPRGGKGKGKEKGKGKGKGRSKPGKTGGTGGGKEADSPGGPTVGSQWQDAADGQNQIRRAGPGGCLMKRRAPCLATRLKEFFNNFLSATDPTPLLMGDGSPRRAFSGICCDSCEPRTQVAYEWYVHDAMTTLTELRRNVMEFERELPRQEHEVQRADEVQRSERNGGSPIHHNSEGRSSNLYSTRSAINPETAIGSSIATLQSNNDEQPRRTIRTSERYAELTNLSDNHYVRGDDESEDDVRRFTKHARRTRATDVHSSRATGPYNLMQELTSTELFFMTQMSTPGRTTRAGVESVQAEHPSSLKSLDQPSPRRSMPSLGPCRPRVRRTPEPIAIDIRSAPNPTIVIDESPDATPTVLWSSSQDYGSPSSNT